MTAQEKQMLIHSEEYYAQFDTYKIEYTYHPNTTIEYLNMRYKIKDNARHNRPLFACITTAETTVENLKEFVAAEILYAKHCMNAIHEAKCLIEDNIPEPESDMLWIRIDNTLHDLSKSVYAVAAIANSPTVDTNTLRTVIQQLAYCSCIFRHMINITHSWGLGLPRTWSLWQLYTSKNRMYIPYLNDTMLQLPFDNYETIVEQYYDAFTPAHTQAAVAVAAAKTPAAHTQNPMRLSDLSGLSDCLNGPQWP